MSTLITWDLIEGETKNFRFTVKDEDGNVIDVSEAVCSLVGKTSLKTKDNLFEKTDEDFNHSNGVNGILTVVLDEEDLDFSGYAYCILKIIITSGEDVDKYIFKLNLQESP